MLKLQFKDQRKPAIWLVDPRYAIGKDTQNTIVLTDEGISPFHAEIRVEGEQVFISDTGSTNGTFVNGKRIQRRTELRSSDVIAIHTVELLVMDPKDVISTKADGVTAITPALSSIKIASVAESRESPWSLKAKTGSLAGKTYTVPSLGKLVVGRANQCEIQLPANSVSRQHAELALSGGKLVVRDLNSSNGTYVNRKKVAEAELKAGDEVRFDTFSFEVDGPAATPAAAESAAPAASARPTIKGAALTPPAVAAEPARAAPAKPAPATRPAAGNPPAPSQPAAAGGGNNALVILVLLLLAGGAAAWFLLK